LSFLARVSYYRVCAYRFYFEDKPGSDWFRDGTDFKHLMRLYEFDRLLRLLVMNMCERVEVLLRAQITYVHSHKYGKFGYLDRRNFAGNFDYDDWFTQVQHEVGKSKEVFVQDFFEKHPKYKNLPWWMFSEIISFGKLSWVYTGMKPEDKLTISQSNFGIAAKLLSWWLHSLVYVRNICAHHSRLFNRRLAISPSPHTQDKLWTTDGKKLFDVLMVFKYLLADDVLFANYIRELDALLKTYPEIEVKAMGFPPHWRQAFEAKRGRS